MSYIVSSGESSNGIILENDTMTVIDGGIVTTTTVNSSGYLHVSSGGTANSTTVNSSGWYYVSSGGTADNTTVNSRGSMYVSSGGTANSTTVNSGGTLNVSAGGTANNVTVNSGGGLTVNNGGTATNIVWTPCEGHVYVYVSGGGYATFASKYSGVYFGSGNKLLSSATVMDGKTLDSAYEMNVMNGGTANSTTVNDWGYLTVSSGGTANGTTVNSRGSMYVSSGGTANSTTVNSGGALNVSAGGTTNNVTVNSGGGLTVNNGGTATNIVWTPCEGYVNVYAGGYATFASEYSGIYFGSGNKLLSNTAVMDGKKLDAAYEMCVMNGGTANSTTVNDWGSMWVSSGGTANSTTVNDRGSMWVSSGGTANSTTVYSGGYLYVSNGGTANSTTVNSNGGMYVSNGGTANSTTVNSGGKLYVKPGGTATGIKAEFGASLNLTVAPNTHISGTYAGSAFEVEDGIISNYTVNSSGRLDVSSGGTANSTTVNSNGRMYVSNGGIANSTTVNRGSMYVSSGGIANSTTVNSGGRLDVSSGGTANSTTVNSNSDVPTCGFIVASGGTAISTTVNSGGKLYVHPGGTATGIKAEFGALLSLEVAPNTHISGTYAGSAFEVEDGIISNYTVNSGYLYVYSGGTAISTTVNSSGWLEVLFGGVANSTTVNSGGSMIVSRSGVANSTTVNGYLYVSSGGTANSATVNSGGSLYVSSGGTMTGQMIFEEGAIVSVYYYGVTLDFDISELAAEAGARVNNLAIIQGTPLYTLKVSAEQAKGVYTLADGAAEFASTISVVNKVGDVFGAFAVGETVKVGYNSYTLNLTDSTLTVTVDVPDLTPQEPVGTADKVSWETTGANEYIVEYSMDNFEHVISVVTTGDAINSPELPAGTYQWRVKADANSEWVVGEAIVSESESAIPKVVQSNEDGNDDLFFVTPVGNWENIYYAQHVGSLNDWGGTNEIVSAYGKGRIQNLFFGSSDPNVLCLTDGENGDAIFVDDVYTDLPENVAEHTARLYKIQEIRAGAGDDIVDMTSQRFEYVGDGLTIRGGDGNDVIWANKGDNFLFGDAGNDRIVGASGNDVLVGGIGNDSMHGGGGNDVFTFCDNWGTDEVEQLSGGSVTLWFASGDESNWNAETLTYTDGDNSVKVFGVTEDKVTLKFGDDGSAQFASLADMGAFFDATTEHIFEESGKGILASL